jgi:hypothetical protein
VEKEMEERLQEKAKKLKELRDKPTTILEEEEGKLSGEVTRRLDR